MLKKTVDENTKMKKELQNTKKPVTSPRNKGPGGLGVSPRFSHGGPAAQRPSPRSRKKEAEKDLLNVDDLNEQLMEKLTSEFEEVFQVDEPLLLVDHDQPTNANTSDDEQAEKADNERHMQEVSKATSLEDKEKFLNALKSKGDHIKTVMGEFLKNTWAQRIQQIEYEKSKAAVEHKKKVIAI